MKSIFAVEIHNSLPPDLSALVLYKRASDEPPTRVMAVGDIGFSGRVKSAISQYGYTGVFGEIAKFLGTGDIVFGNLEFPLVPADQANQMFAGNPDGAAALHEAGFTHIHLANNHVGEYGSGSLSSTLAAVQSAKMIPLGAGADLQTARQLVNTKLSNLHIGWLSCGRTLVRQEELGPHYWEFDEPELLQAVEQARSQVDVLIVSIHIGLMYMDYPRPEHKIMAERLMAAGAHIILMHHAHVLQGVQVTAEGRVCCYNLGNFLLDWQDGNVEIPVMVKEQNEGAVFVFDLDSKGIAKVAAIPYYIHEDSRLFWAVGERGNAIVARLERISQDLDGNYTNLFEHQRAERNTGGSLKVLLFHVQRGHWSYIFQQITKVRSEHLRMLWRWSMMRWKKRKA
jgi:poly-gamma-glutamate capsule biosynthesis protein CapA/YwtB (metallophosphatase superfamily)